MTPFALQCIKEVCDLEGGYTNDPNDSGGETNFGITIATARAYGYTLPMSVMTEDQAIIIYKQKFWDTLRLDDVEKLSQKLAYEMFEAGVNVGVSEMGTWLQRGLNVLNMHATFYPELKVDGNVGNMTISCLTEYLKRRPDNGVLVLMRVLNSLQGEFYVSLAERREKDEDFIYGWFLKRVS